MSEEDLELLVTLDDPEGAPEEDHFHHLPGERSGPHRRAVHERTKPHVSDGAKANSLKQSSS